MKKLTAMNHHIDDCLDAMKFGLDVNQKFEETSITVTVEPVDAGQIRMGAPLDRVANKAVLDQIINEFSKQLRGVVVDMCEPQVKLKMKDGVPTYTVTVSLGFHSVKRII